MKTNGTLILHEGDFLILNKPSGMSVHNEKPSLADELAAAGRAKLHFVNRLDRDTSGLVVATADAGKVAALTAALQAGRKTYRAIVKSTNTPPTEWVWNHPLTDKAEGRRDPYGKTSDRIPAETQVRLAQHNDWFWDLEIQLVTGRQHQIRKHAAGANLPLVGDPRYGREALNRKVAETYGFSRMMLHAWRLEFQWNNQTVIFEAPLPVEFAQLVSGATAT